MESATAAGGLSDRGAEVGRRPTDNHTPIEYAVVVVFIGFIMVVGDSMYPQTVTPAAKPESLDHELRIR